MRRNFQQERAEIEARKSPEQRAKESAIEAAKEIKYAYDALHESVEYYSDAANKKVEEFNKNQGTYDSLGWRDRKMKEIDNLRSEGVRLIDDFLKKYKGKLPQAMIDHLNQDKKKLRSGDSH